MYVQMPTAYMLHKMPPNQNGFLTAALQGEIRHQAICSFLPTFAVADIDSVSIYDQPWFFFYNQPLNLIYDKVKSDLTSHIAQGAEDFGSSCIAGLAKPLHFGRRYFYEQ